ncbi:hypothetical protein BRADI_1g63000v3 [Brachypodium distachyon]|uniref:RING-type E3 ubiquitin transferase n=2 Tax=Brachypodium distachyon TaxID=15368 RepID=I1H5P1_BRADI|nr:hypothetical protein BRADI_1g63000v3 [Brachypodium distachyon]
MATRRWLTPNAATPSTAAADPADPPPHLGWDANRSAVRVAIFGNVLVVLLFFAAVIWRLYFSGTGSTQQQQHGAVATDGEAAASASASSSGASSPSASPRAKGLQKGDLMALPVYVHRALPDQEGKVVVECAVCICELKDGDTGRHLPACGHRFHAECVDRWFRSHATCPLCRAVVVSGGSGDVDPKAPPG